MTVQATAPPEILLREPLDAEFVLNRKMAQKFYQSELKNKMEENRQKQIEDRQKYLRELSAKRRTKEEKVEKTFKETQKALKAMADDKNADRAHRRDQRIRQERIYRQQVWEKAKQDLTAAQQKEIDEKKNYD